MDNTSQLDPRALNLAKAIRQTESGGDFTAKGKSGEYGAYQFMPETWKSSAKKWLGNENAEMTPSNQNAVAYLTIKDYADKGYNPAQIAAAWNSGSPDGWENKIGTNSKGVAYDVPGYVKKVIGNYQTIKSGGQPSPEQVLQEPAQPAVDTYGALFPSAPTDNGLVAGAKAVGNLPTSGYNFVKGIATAARHPIDTLNGIGNAVLGGINKGVEKLTGYQIERGESGAQKNATFDALAGALKDRYGSLENLQRTATNDPFGFGSDVFSILEGGAGLLGKTGELGNIVSKVGGTAARPLEAAAAKTTKIVKDAAGYGVSQATGLTRDAISNIVKTPEEFNAGRIADTSREGFASDVKDIIDTRLDDLRDVGKGYSKIKETPGTVEIKPVQVIDPVTQVPKITSIDSILGDYGINVIDGKIKLTSESRPLSAADKAGIEDFLNIYGNEKILSPNAFLNAREALANLAKYDSAKTPISADVARDLRTYYNEVGREQVPGLKDLDEVYAPEVKTLNKIKKDYLAADGTFKPGAVNKLANLTGKGKGEILSRLEELMPGAEQRIKILKSVEDIKAAGENKVGTYARSGSLVGGIATGNIPLIVASILAVPEVAVSLLRAYGTSAKQTEIIIKALTKAVNDRKFLVSPRYQSYMAQYVGNLLESADNKDEKPITAQ